MSALQGSHRRGNSGTQMLNRSEPGMVTVLQTKSSGHSDMQTSVQTLPPGASMQKPVSQPSLSLHSQPTSLQGPVPPESTAALASAAMSAATSPLSTASGSTASPASETTASAPTSSLIAASLNRPSAMLSATPEPLSSPSAPAMSPHPPASTSSKKATASPAHAVPKGAHPPAALRRMKRPL